MCEYLARSRYADDLSVVRRVVGKHGMSNTDRAGELRKEILNLVSDYYTEAFPERPFVGGISAVPVSGKVFDNKELELLVDSSLDFWLTTGRYAEQFEKKFAKVMGTRHALLCNSGSSANLLAMSALTSPKLRKRALKTSRLLWVPKPKRYLWLTRLVTLLT